MPPAKSGIADYSAALVESLRRQAEVTVFENGDNTLSPAAFDIPVYQIGNNVHHAFAYEQAMQTPGVVVM